MRVGTQGLSLNEKLIFEHSTPGRQGYSLPPLDVPEVQLPAEMVRKELAGFPNSRKSMWCATSPVFPPGITASIPASIPSAVAP